MNDNYRGDTIVEVLIAIVVLGAAIGGAFAIANKSQLNAQDNHERHQAQLLVNQQAELLRQYYIDVTAVQGKSRSDFNTLMTGKQCIDIASGIPQTTPCSVDSIYTITITDAPNPENVPGGITPLTYSIQATWNKLGTGQISTTELLYGL